MQLIILIINIDLFIIELKSFNNLKILKDKEKRI